MGSQESKQCETSSLLVRAESEEHASWPEFQFPDVIQTCPGQSRTTGSYAAPFGLSIVFLKGQYPHPVILVFNMHTLEQNLTHRLQNLEYIDCFLHCSFTFMLWTTQVWAQLLPDLNPLTLREVQLGFI